jgi:glycosyltransferase involved in cell wall biosynthesis
MRAVALHDRIVARRLKKLSGQIDIIHTWPLGALQTLKTAARLGIPTVLERCNAHTGYAMEVVQKECDRLGVSLPPNQEHAFNAWKLRKEEDEYELADRLLCPSDFVVKTFVDRGFPQAKLARHQYGFDEKGFYPDVHHSKSGRGLTVIFVGLCAVRKGVHYALEAWLKSPASKDGTFLIAGEFLPEYQEKLASMLTHPSVKVLGHRNDVPELMRKSDILVLPSIEEGSALVTSEARGSGCVLLVSEAAGAICQHMENALVHKVGDVAALAQHLAMLHEDRDLLEKLRAASLATISELTWDTAGVKLLDVYRETIAAYRSGTPTNLHGLTNERRAMNPKVSVVIPTYNRAAKVRKGIESVLTQTFSDLEIIVVDDGSADDTANVIAKTFGDRIRYYYQTNQGASAARNRGIAEARGEWIAFLDSDDEWERDKLEWQFKTLERFTPECGGCYTDVRLVNNPETRTFFQLAKESYRHQGQMGVSKQALELLVRPGGAGMVICLSSFMGRADLIRKTGGFDLKLPYSQDSEFLFRLAMATNFCYVNRPLIRFDRSPVEQRHVGVSAQWTKLDFWLRDSQLRLEGLLRFRQHLPKEVVDLIHEQLGSIHSGWANWYLSTGDYARAREAISRAMRLDPTFSIALKWLLTWTSPGLASRAVRYRLERSQGSIA